MPPRPMLPPRRPPPARRPTAALLAATLAALGAADAAAQPPTAARATVRGVVYDSLLGRPLGRAAVWIEGTDRTTVTDSAGRFALDSVPGGATRRIAATHDELEALGFPTLGADVDVPATGAAEVTLATPSAATMRARVCRSSGDRGEDAASGGPGIVFGEVRDASTDSRLAGASARLSWTQVDTVAGKLRVGAPTRTVRTDSIGVYYACGLPIGVELEGQAYAAPFWSGRAVLAVGPRGVARLDLLVSREPDDTAAVAAAAPRPAAGAGAAAPTPAPTPAPAPGERRGRAVLSGVVRDTLGAGRSGVVVSIEGLSGEARTDAQGRYTLASLPAGTQTVVVRAVGYQPQLLPVGLRNGATTNLDVTLRRAVTLAGVVVRARAEARNRLLGEIEQRRREGVGTLLDSTLLGRMPQLATALQRAPFLEIQRQPGMGWRVVLGGVGGGRCVARVFVDGQEVDWDAARDLPPEELLAAEVFRRPSEIPLRYGGTSLNSSCGAVFLWTKTAR